jgi:OmpA-OmpF porin, OOP family
MEELLMLKKLAAIALLSLSSTAFAQTGLYVGLGAGRASAEIDAAGLTSVDDSDTGFKIYGGYEFTPNFAVEVGYADLGKLSAVDATPPPTSTSFESSAVFADAVGLWPINREVSLFARAGFAFTTLDIRSSTPGLGSVVAGEDETNLKLGLGAQFNVTRNVALRAEWERYLDVGEDATTGESDVDVMGVSLNVRF